MVQNKQSLPFIELWSHCHGAIEQVSCGDFEGYGDRAVPGYGDSAVPGYGDRAVPAPGLFPLYRSRAGSSPRLSPHVWRHVAASHHVTRGQQLHRLPLVLRHHLGGVVLKVVVSVGNVVASVGKVVVNIGMVVVSVGKIVASVGKVVMSVV